VEDAPRRGDLPANVERVERTLGSLPKSDLVVFPELFLSGYRVGDRLARLALHPGSPELRRLSSAAESHGSWVVVGTPWRLSERPGEVLNVALALGPKGERGIQGKRYLPNFGPFEEGIHLSPVGRSEPLSLLGGSIGWQICYDTFFPEVSRDLALGGAQAIGVLSASPVTSRALFEKLLPARAIENGLPVAFCNRTGVEDGMVFAGGSGLWDVRGERVPPEEERTIGETRWLSYTLDLEEAARWRPFRPVLRDLST
jgi:predicted amidohydrolase